jgi:predicted ATPase
MGEVEELRDTIDIMTEDIEDIEGILRLRGNRFNKATLLAVKKGLDTAASQIEGVVVACEREGLVIVDARRSRGSRKLTPSAESQRELPR